MSSPDDKAIFALDADDHVLGVWFAAWRNDGKGWPCDIMAMLWRGKADGNLHFVFRTRYDAGTDDMGDDEKKSSHFVLGYDDGKRAAVACAEIMRKAVEAHPGELTVPLDYIRVAGKPDKMLAMLSTRDWCHVGRGVNGN